jgi:hypothetical protein
MQTMTFDEEVAEKAAQAAAVAAAAAAAAAQQEQKEKELLWEDQACMRCGSKVRHRCRQHQVLAACVVAAKRPDSCGSGCEVMPALVTWYTDCRRMGLTARRA